MQMHNVLLIARREYLERVRTRGFIVTTIMIPLIMAGFIYGSTFTGSKSAAQARVSIVSFDPQLSLDLQDKLEQQPAHDASGKPLHLAADAMSLNPSDERATRAILDNRLDGGDLDGYLWITGDLNSHTPTSYTFTPRSPKQDYLGNIVATALTTVVKQPVTVQILRRPPHADPDSAGISITVLFFLMYMVIMLYGMNVARSIIEEKTSRIFEVLLATIRPEAMMAGKIIGVGSVGITQVGIWLAAVLVFGNAFAAKLGAGSIHIGLTTPQLVYFFVYFLLGYTFYSSIAAALGAMTNSEQELQQLNMFLVLPLAFCFVVLHRVLVSPDGNLTRILALIPPFTPLLMYLRVSLGHPHPWEVALSIGLTSASIWVIIWITSRIYRVGVLMYGKRPSLSELLRWLKYS